MPDLEARYRKLVLRTVPWTLAGFLAESTTDPLFARKRKNGRLETEYAYRRLLLPIPLARALVAQSAGCDPRVHRVSIGPFDGRACVVEERQLHAIDYAARRVLRLHAVAPGCASAARVIERLARWHIGLWRRAVRALAIVQYWRRGARGARALHMRGS